MAERESDLARLADRDDDTETTPPCIPLTVEPVDGRLSGVSPRRARGGVPAMKGDTMRGLMIALLIALLLATAVAAEEPNLIVPDGAVEIETTPIQWASGLWDGIPDTDGDAELAKRVLQLERQVADLTRRLDEAEKYKAELYGRGTEPLTIQTEPPSNPLELQSGSAATTTRSYYDGCDWTHCTSTELVRQR